MRTKLLLVLVASAAAYAAGDGALDRATLRGIPAVNVVIDPIPADVQSQGVTRENLRARLEERLRAGNIKIDPARTEFVGIRMTSVRAARGPYGVSIDIALYQPVQLSRDPKIKTATQTWEIESIVLAEPKQLQQACQDTIDDLAARFLAAYHAVNR